MRFPKTCGDLYTAAIPTTSSLSLDKRRVEILADALAAADQC
jgi:hypothetical protein